MQAVERDPFFQGNIQRNFTRNDIFVDIGGKVNTFFPAKQRSERRRQILPCAFFRFGQYYGRCVRVFFKIVFIRRHVYFRFVIRIGNRHFCFAFRRDNRYVRFVFLVNIVGEQSPIFTETEGQTNTFKFGVRTQFPHRNHLVLIIIGRFYRVELRRHRIDSICALLRGRARKQRFRIDDIIGQFVPPHTVLFFVLFSRQNLVGCTRSPFRFYAVPVVRIVRSRRTDNRLPVPEELLQRLRRRKTAVRNTNRRSNIYSVFIIFITVHLLGYHRVHTAVHLTVIMRLHTKFPRDIPDVFQTAVFVRRTAGGRSQTNTDTILRLYRRSTLFAPKQKYASHDYQDEQGNRYTDN